MDTHTGETMLGFEQATKPLRITEGIDGLTLSIETGKLGQGNAHHYMSEIMMLYSWKPFTKKMTLQLDANDIDSSGLAILGIFSNFCRASGNEQPVLELNRERGPYIERQLAHAGMGKDFEIRYH
jgi:hypothetical protein